MNPFSRHQRLRENLSAYIDGELSPRETANVEGHLEGCGACRETLEALRLASTSLNALQAEEVPRSFRLTPDVVAAPRPAPAQLPAVNTGFRIAAAGLAVALAAVMIVDRAAIDSGDESASTQQETSADEAPETAAGGIATEEMFDTGGEEAAGGAPAPVEMEPQATIGTSDLATEERQGATEASPVPALPDDSDASGADAGVAPAQSDENDGSSTVLLIEVLLAVLLALAVGGVAVLWFAERRRRV
jgi:hypothetical protein